MRRIQRYPADDVNEASEAPLAELPRPAPADEARVRAPSSASHHPDPIDELIGSLVDVDPVDDIDTIVYGLEA